MENCGGPFGACLPAALFPTSRNLLSQTPLPYRLPLALLPTALWVPSGLTAFGGSPFGTLPTGGCFRTFRNDLFLVFSFTPPAAGFITGSIASGTGNSYNLSLYPEEVFLWDLGCPFGTLPIGCCFRIFWNYFMLLYPIPRLKKILQIVNKLSASQYEY